MVTKLARAANRILTFNEGEAALTYAPGTRYLIQHAAGLRKPKTIAWTAHFFSERQDAEHKKRLIE